MGTGRLSLVRKYNNMTSHWSENTIITIENSSRSKFYKPGELNYPNSYRSPDSGIKFDKISILSLISDQSQIIIGIIGSLRSVLVMMTRSVNNGRNILQSPAPPHSNSKRCEMHPTMSKIVLWQTS